jgi:hypothetical protein
MSIEQNAKRYVLLRKMFLQWVKNDNSPIFDKLKQQPEPTDEAGFDAAIDAVMADE